MATERYSFSLTTFSPSGKLVQIEYALAAVAAGAPSVGIKASNGVVIATENKHKSILYEEHSVHKVEMITDHIGMVYSGNWVYIIIFTIPQTTPCITYQNLHSLDIVLIFPEDYTNLLKRNLVCDSNELYTGQ